jgi:hypothetical protein
MSIHVNIQRILGREIFTAEGAGIHKTRIEVNGLHMIPRVPAHTKDTSTQRALKAVAALVLGAPSDEAVQLIRIGQFVPRLGAIF